MGENEFDDMIYDAAAEETKMEEELEAARRARRQERLQKMQRAKKRSMLFRRYGLIGAALLVSVAVLAVVLVQHGKSNKNPRYIAPQEDMGMHNSEAGNLESESEADIAAGYEAHLTDATASFPESVVSSYGVLIDVENQEILAQKGAYERINPASMTKIFTVLVAAEHMTPEQLDDTFTMTIDITDYSYVNDCSNTGFEVDEVMTVRDLFYGTILPSGADSAVGLATYVAGSHEAFVDMMNEKLEQMGLSATTHFTNCVGLYDKEHYTTPYDMAMILKAATDNEWCRQVLSEHVYTTSPTEQHPEGLIISNWFLRRIEDRDTHGEVLCAKTGYVSQSGSCAASLANDRNGKEYICVTAGSTTSWRCIYDHVDLYTAYLPDVDIADTSE